MKPTVTDSYLQIKEIACRLGYKSFTKLQKKAFQMEEYSHPQAWLFVIGATSSGKTLIPLLEFFRRRLSGEKPRMLLAVPYRALAQQKLLEVQEMAEKLGLSLDIRQSTAEFRDSDNDIRNGSVDAAIIIYEKVFMFSCMDSSFLRNYNLFVADEVGLTQDAVRGIKVDFILAQCRAIPELKLTALATPFYDWSEYIRVFGFAPVFEPERPVEIFEYPIYCYKRKMQREFVVDHVSGCQAVAEGTYPIPRNRTDDPNPRQWIDPLMVDLCEYHLSRGHKILIFENNREEVRRLSHRLCRSLKLRGKLSAWQSPEECRTYISRSLNVSENALDMELYGVLTDDDYDAFSNGISYHNAQMPNKLRTLVEHEILNTVGRLRVVCCTETLAYGINSNVDVVVIPDMMKSDPDNLEHRSFLSANEYMNYAGRAGRLQLAESEISPGYVYPILRGRFLSTEEEIASAQAAQGRSTHQQLLWELLQQRIRTPEHVASQYFTVGAEGKPFYLLSLFQRWGERYRAVSFEELERILRRLPTPTGRAFQLEEDLIIPLHYLLSHSLICEDDDSGENLYILSDSGAALTGYIIFSDDYDRIISAAQEAIFHGELPIVDLLYTVAQSRTMNSEIKTLFRVKEPRWSIENAEQQAKQQARRKECAQNAAGILRKYHKDISPQLKAQLSEKLGIRFPSQEGEERLKLDGFDGTLQLVAALLFWVEVNCNVRKLYDQFHISYAQFQRIAEQVSYLLDIVSLSFSAIKAAIGSRLLEAYGYDQAMPLS